MYTASDNDSRLVFALKKGEEKAFRILFDRYWVQVYTLIHRRIRDEEASKDIVQSIFVSLWLSRKEIIIEETLLPYLHRAAKNKAISFYHQNSSAFTREQVFHDDQVQHPIDNHIEANELEAFFQAEIEDMPDTMRKAFLLSRQQDKSIREIAAELSMSEQTIKNNISQALDRLRKRTKTYYSDPAHLSVLLFVALTNF